MIFTITFNPSLDYIVPVKDFRTGTVNRAAGESIYPGGKGVNVSIMLRNLGCESVALGFCAGFTGREILRMLEANGCRTDFIPLENGFSRINVKIKSGEESEINGQGPAISEAAQAELFQKLDRLTGEDVLVLAGSIPDSLPDDSYEQILRRLDGRGIRTVVDATGELLRRVLPYGPFLIKPNNHELGQLFGKELRDRDEIVAHARLLQREGAKNVLVSMAGDGAVLVAEDGQVIHSLPPKGKVVNSVGAGDSMVAGFLAGYLRTGDYSRAFRLGLCAGSASAFQPWLATRDQVAALLEAPGEYGI